MEIAVLGYGTVGSGVVEVLEVNQKSIAQKAGENIHVKYVLDLRDFFGQPIQDRIVHDYETILNDPEIKIVVEVLGGVEPAYTYVRQALETGKSVATSNKELVAKHGADLLALAKENNVNFMFEASVGGGIPIIRPLISSLTADEITEITGILNGTTNYILTSMVFSGKSFDEALSEARALGYAEADPSADVDGIDTCRKICILSALAYGTIYPSELVPTEGIRNITPRDVSDAAGFGASVKLIANTRKTSDGKIMISVAPRFVPAENPLYNVRDVFNGILVSGEAVGDLMFYGRGAGRIPTAGAVLADIVEIIKHMDSKQLPPPVWVRGGSETLADAASEKSRFYCRVKGRRVPDNIISGKHIYSDGETSFVTVETDLAELEKQLAGYEVTARYRFI